MFSVNADKKEHFKVKKLVNNVWSSMSFKATSEDKLFAYDLPMFDTEDSDDDEVQVNYFTVTKLLPNSKKKVHEPMNLYRRVTCHL